MNHRSSPAIQRLPARESAVGACVRVLRESILSGKLAPGERLPAERELAETLGVNRLTLRNALSQLAAAGLLSVRHGSGHVVRDFLDEGGPDLLPAILALATGAESREALADLLQIRRSLAGAVVARVAERIDTAGLARLDRAVDAYEAVASRPGVTVEELAVADRDTVRALLRETGSTAMALIANPVFRVLDALPEVRAANYASPETNVAGFRLVVAALRAKDHTALRQVVSVLEALDEALLARLAQKSRKPSPRTRRSK